MEAVQSFSIGICTTDCATSGISQIWIRSGERSPLQDSEERTKYKTQKHCKKKLGMILAPMSGGTNNLSEFLPISFFRRVSRFIGVSGHLALE